MTLTSSKLVSGGQKIRAGLNLNDAERLVGIRCESVRGKGLPIERAQETAGVSPAHDAVIVQKIVHIEAHRKMVRRTPARARIELTEGGKVKRVVAICR